MRRFVRLGSRAPQAVLQRRAANLLGSSVSGAASPRGWPLTRQQGCTVVQVRQKGNGGLTRPGPSPQPESAGEKLAASLNQKTRFQRGLPRTFDAEECANMDQRQCENLVESECDAGGLRATLSVAAPFVWRCLTRSPVAPFPHPAHRTGHADLPHPALGQDVTPSPTTGRVQAVSAVRA
jgi:hypothetical protein